MPAETFPSSNTLAAVTVVPPLKYEPAISVPAEILPSSVLSICTGLVVPPRLIATVVERGAISTMPVVTSLLAPPPSLWVKVSPIKLMRPPPVAVRVAGVAPSPSWMPSPATATW